MQGAAFRQTCMAHGKRSVQFTMRYGFIGCGNMGGAVARAVCRGAGAGQVLLANRTAAKAEALAGGAQVTLVGTPISIQETSTNRNVATLTMEAAVAEERAEDEAAVAAPISASDMEVTAQVTAVFEIR